MKRDLLYGLVLRLLGGRSTEGLDMDLNCLSSSEWDAVIRFLSRHDVASLFYRRVKKLIKESSLPDRIVQELRRTYLYNAARNTQIYYDLTEVIENIRREGIEVIVLKGAHLAALVYDDIALRPMNDIDIMVRKDDLSTVERRLLSMGYGPVERPGIEEQCSRHYHLIAFTKAGRPRVEVHWTLALTSPVSIGIEDLWERARRLNIASTEALVLSPEDLLLHLCLHVSFIHKFEFFEIKNICDISEIVRRYERDIDWGLVVSSARKYGISKYIYCTLSLARRLLGAEIPYNKLDELKGDTGDGLIGKIEDYIFSERVAAIPSVFRRMEEENKPALKMRLLVQTFFPTGSYLQKRYSHFHGSRLTALFYMFYFGEVLMRGALLLFLAVFRSKDIRFSVERERNKASINKWLRQ